LTYAEEAQSAPAQDEEQKVEVVEPVKEEAQVQM